MTVNFTIVSLFNGKNKVDSSAFQAVFVKSKVPAAHLEQMQAILWSLFLVNRRHQFIHVFHNPFSIFVFFHEASGLKLFNVEELVFATVIFKALGNLIITITNASDDHILLAHFDGFVLVEDVVVLDQTTERKSELLFVFVVHGDADGELWLRFVFEDTNVLHSSDKAGIFDLSQLAILSETTWTHDRIVCCLAETHGFVRNEFSWLPFRSWSLCKVLIITFG